MKSHLRLYIDRVFLVLLFASLAGGCVSSEKTKSVKKTTYHHIAEFSPDVNAQLKSFLINSESISGRKVAIFDVDGTLIGQVPHYLADEALYKYAKNYYQSEEDSVSRAKMNIVNKMAQGDNVGDEYVTNRIHFFSAIPADSLEQWGHKIYKTLYQDRFYPGMRKVIDNLRAFGFEIWVITASPEVLYQKFIADELDIPTNRIIGVKSAIIDGIISDKIVYPIPQDEGKAHTIDTFIKKEPLFVAGNSRGDVEMIEQSKGMKWIVNPDNQKQEQIMDCMTLKDYARKNNWVIVYRDDQPDSSYYYISDEWNIPLNTRSMPGQ